MKVAVTGASGHVGANLVRELVARGDEVRAIVHDSTAGLDGLDVERIRADVRDPESLVPAFDGVERVYHLAALISISGDKRGRVFDTNVGGAGNVAAVALECGVRRMVHVSSIHAFEQSPLDEPLDETRAKVGSGRRHPAYDRSKAAGEQAVRTVIDRGLDAVIVNPTGVVGPNDWAQSRTGRALLNMFRSKLPALVAGGFDWVDVRDVAAGIIAAGERGRTGENYILSGQWASVRELATVVGEVTGSRPPKFTVPMWLARVGVPFSAVVTWITRRDPLFTGEALAALRANRDIRRDKAGAELGYFARPLRDTIEAVFEDLAVRGVIDRKLLSP